MALNQNEPGSDTTDSRIAELYREAAREDSPPRLDAALMAAARRGLTAAGPVRRAWSIPWRVPFAVAALAVISLSLVMLVMDEGGERVGPLENRSGQRDPSSPPRDVRMEEPRFDPQGGAAVQPQSAPETVPKRPPTGRQSATGAAESPSRMRAQREEGVTRDDTASRDAAGSLASASAGADVAQYSAAPAASPVAASAPRARVESESRVAEERGVSPAPAARSAPAPRPEAQLRSQETNTGASSDARSPEVERQVRELDGEPVRVWLDRVQLLRRDGRSVEASELLKEFRRRYPKEALPPELR